MKKILTVTVLAALALLLCTCDAYAVEAPGAPFPESDSDFENSVLGEVITIDGSTVTLQLGSIGSTPADMEEQSLPVAPPSGTGFITDEETETYVLDGLEISIHSEGSIAEGSIADIAIGDLLIIVEDEDNVPELVIIWRNQLMAAPSAAPSEPPG